jgi:hypothetical protein
VELPGPGPRRPTAYQLRRQLAVTTGWHGPEIRLPALPGLPTLGATRLQVARRRHTETPGVSAGSSDHRRGRCPTWDTLRPAGVMITRMGHAPASEGRELGAVSRGSALTVSDQVSRGRTTDTFCWPGRSRWSHNDRLEPGCCWWASRTPLARLLSRQAGNAQRRHESCGNRSIRHPRGGGSPQGTAIVRICLTHCGLACTPVVSPGRTARGMVGTSGPIHEAASGFACRTTTSSGPCPPPDAGCRCAPPRG